MKNRKSIVGGRSDISVGRQDSEQRLNDALDLLAGGASDDAVDADDEPPDGPSGPENELRTRQNPISIAHVTRTPASDTVSDERAQAPDQGKEVGARGLEPPTSAV